MKEHNVYTSPVQTVTDTEQLLAVFDQTFLLLQREYNTEKRYRYQIMGTCINIG